MAGPCPTEGTSCVRTNIEKDQGICYPVTTCAGDSECGDGQTCLTRWLARGSTGVAGLDNLYCVPKPDAADHCPAGSTSVGPVDDAICVPTCSIGDPRCPPGLACLTQLQQLSAIANNIPAPFCFLGYGYSCNDDTNCFLGRCVDTGTAQGKICTLTCNEASRIAGGCENLVNDTQLEALLYEMACDRTAGHGGSDGSGLCVLRYHTDFPSCTGPDGAYPCAAGLSCLSVPNFPEKICTKECTTAAQCAVPGRSVTYECNFGYCTLPLSSTTM